MSVTETGYSFSHVVGLEEDVLRTSRRHRVKPCVVSSILMFKWNRICVFSVASPIHFEQEECSKQYTFVLPVLCTGLGKGAFTLCVSNQKC